MIKIIHRFLLKQDPEKAHHMGISFLRVLQKAPRFLLNSSGPLIKLSYDSVKELAFKGRVGLAAGFDKNAEVFPALSRLGFGFVEVGSVTPLPQEGNPKPRIFRIPGEGLVNHLGFNNCGLVQFKKNIEKNRKRIAVPLFANIGKGKNTPNEEAISDYEKGILALKDLVDGFVVNVSSPNTPGLFQLQTTEFITALEKIIPPGKPTWLKLSPDLSNENLIDMAKMIMKDSPLSGLVLTNTSRERADQKDFPQGGLSGPELFDRSLARLGLCRKHLPLNKIIIGVGGISSVENAKKMREAGADLLEVYTSFVYQGPSLIKRLNVTLS